MVKCHSSFTIAEQVEVSHFKRKKEPFFLIINLSVNVLCEMRTYSPTSTSYCKFASYPNIIIVILKNTTLLDFYLGTDL